MKTKRMLAWLFIAVIITISGTSIGVILYGFINYDIKTCIVVGNVSFWSLFAIQHRKGVNLDC